MHQLTWFFFNVPYNLLYQFRLYLGKPIFRLYVHFAGSHHIFIQWLRLTKLWSQEVSYFMHSAPLFWALIDWTNKDFCPAEYFMIVFQQSTLWLFSNRVLYDCFPAEYFMIVFQQSTLWLFSNRVLYDCFPAEYFMIVFQQSTLSLFYSYCASLGLPE